jgi:hypothetical protein
VQVDEELAVGERAAQPVGDVHGERGLAHPGHTGDRLNARAGRGEAGDLGPAADERAGVGRERAGGGRLVAQHDPVQLAQGRPGLGAELLDQAPPHSRPAVQSLGGAAVPVQRLDVDGGEWLDQRVLLDQRPQPVDHGGGVAGGQPRSRPPDRGVEAALGGLVAGAGHPLAGQVGQGRAVPQGQCRLELAAPGQVVEEDQIDAGGVDVERVATVTAGHGRAAQGTAQAGHVAVDDGAHLAGRAVAPDPVDDRVDLDRVARVDRERGQNRALPCRAQRHVNPVDVQLHRPQQPQPDVGHRWTLRRAVP